MSLGGVIKEDSFSASSTNMSAELSLWRQD